MKEVILLGIGSCIGFVCFIVLLIVGLFKKSTTLILSSLLILVISIFLGVFTGYRTITKSLNKVSKIMEPRDGKDIYNALFNDPIVDCVTVIDYQDQAVIIDDTIWIHFSTCPEECARILSEFNYDKKLLNNDWHSNSNNMSWWQPNKMGDSIRIYNYFISDRNERVMWVSKDSTQVFCKDILY